MNETYNLKAIILKREPFRECDARITLYSRERGKLELIARGAKKIRSKMAGHLEPITLASIMAVRGKIYDYVGGVASEKCFSGVKGSLEKSGVAGEAIHAFNRHVKKEERDEKVFNLLLDFLNVINDSRKDNGRALLHIFSFRLLSILGYRPELKSCVVCGEKIMPGNNIFSPARGGITCGKHGLVAKGLEVKISDSCVKIFRLAGREGWDELEKMNLNDYREEMKTTMKSFSEYCV